jgi:hypothetical protein
MMTKKSLVPQTIADLVTTYSVYVDGKKLGGCQKIDLDFDITGSCRTEVALRLAVKRDSLRITPIKGKPGLKRIDFSTCNEAFK